MILAGSRIRKLWSNSARNSSDHRWATNCGMSLTNTGRSAAAVRRSASTVSKVRSGRRGAVGGESGGPGVGAPVPRHAERLVVAGQVTPHPHHPLERGRGRARRRPQNVDPVPRFMGRSFVRALTSSRPGEVDRCDPQRLEHTPNRAQNQQTTTGRCRPRPRCSSIPVQGAFGLNAIGITRQLGIPLITMASASGRPFGRAHDGFQCVSSPGNIQKLLVDLLLRRRRSRDRRSCRRSRRPGPRWPGTRPARPASPASSTPS